MFTAQATGTQLFAITNNKNQGTVNYEQPVHGEFPWNLYEENISVKIQATNKRIL